MIALTGYDGIAEKDLCYSNGFDAFIPKPIKLEALAETIAQIQQ